MSDKITKRITKNILFTTGIMWSTLIICEALYRNNFGDQNINILMALAIFIITAVTEEYIYGVIASVVGVFGYDFLITTPRYGFSFTVDFPVTLLVLLLVVFTSSIITRRIKDKAREASERHKHAELLYSINRKLLSTRDLDTIAKYSIEYLRDEFRRSVAFFVDVGADNEIPPYFAYEDEDVSYEYFTRQETYNLVRQTIAQQTRMKSEEYGQFIPAISQETSYGAFVFSYKEEEFDEKQEMFLEIIAEQAGQALRVYSLMMEQQEIRLMIETEKTKNSFLRSISHDLRTPLTSIIGASSTLLEEGDEIPRELQIKLVEGIHSDSDWLLNMIESILSITKVQQNNMMIEKTEEIVEEVIEGAVLTFHKRFPEANITVEQPPNTVLVPIDMMLISQVMNNLLENTQRHARGHKSDVHIKVEEKAECIRFFVSDTGPGIDANIFPKLFDFMVTSDNLCKDSTRNLGIGLSICKTIIEAHGGEISARNLPEGGAEFAFSLPLL